MARTDWGRTLILALVVFGVVFIGWLLYQSTLSDEVVASSDFRDLEARLSVLEERVDPSVALARVETAKVWRSTLLWLVIILVVVSAFSWWLRQKTKPRSLSVNDFLRLGQHWLLQQRSFNTRWCDIVGNWQRNPESELRIFMGMFVSEAVDGGDPDSSNVLFVIARNDSWETRFVAPANKSLNQVIDWLSDVANKAHFHINASSRAAAIEKIKEVLDESSAQHEIIESLGLGDKQ